MQQSTDAGRNQILGLSPYEAWQEREGIPVYEANYVENMYTLPLGPWDRKGGTGAYVNLAGQYEDDAMIVEIPPGGELKPDHHMYEAMIFVLAGRGATTVWGPDVPKRTVEWKAGSLFASPLNMWYQHFNASGTEPARLLAVTRQPKIFELYRSPEFVYNCDFAFNERFAGQEDYFTDPGARLKRLVWKTNFVPDVRTFALEEYPERGPGFNMKFVLSDNSMIAHVSEFPIATYKKGHRHGPGAHVIIIGGEGYSLLWFEGDKERTRVNWRDGSILSPAARMYHQHFNGGPTPARYLALRLGGNANPQFRPRRLAQDAEHLTERARDQIEYQTEDPSIRAEYAAEIAKHGLELQVNDANYRIEDTIARVRSGELARLRASRLGKPSLLIALILVLAACAPAQSTPRSSSSQPQNPASDGPRGILRIAEPTEPETLAAKLAGGGAAVNEFNWLSTRT